MVPNVDRTQVRAGSSLFEALRSARSGVSLSSPYLTVDVAHKISMIARGHEATWRLLTKLDPVALAGGYLSAAGLRSLLRADVSVRTHPRLHAKVYLADDFGLAGSANLTSSGLGLTARHNAELSVSLIAPEIIEAGRIYDEWWSSATEVDEAALLRAEELASALPATPKSATVDAQETTDAAVERILTDARDPSRTLWIKAQNGAPSLEQWRHPHWFSSPARGRPRFAPGDLVLIFAKEARGAYAVLEVAGSASFDPDFVTVNSNGESWIGERWPWVTKTIPRIVPSELIVVTREQLGISPHSLQGGHKVLSLNEFATGVRALAQQIA